MKTTTNMMTKKWRTENRTRMKRIIHTPIIDKPYLMLSNGSCPPNTSVISWCRDQKWRILRGRFWDDGADVKLVEFLDSDEDNIRVDEHWIIRRVSPNPNITICQSYIDIYPKHLPKHLPQTSSPPTKLDENILILANRISKPQLLTI